MIRACGARSADRWPSAWAKCLKWRSVACGSIDRVFRVDDRARAPIEHDHDEHLDQHEQSKRAPRSPVDSNKSPRNPRVGFRFGPPTHHTQTCGRALARCSPMGASGWPEGFSCRNSGRPRRRGRASPRHGRPFLQSAACLHTWTTSIAAESGHRRPTPQRPSRRWISRSPPSRWWRSRCQ